MAAIGFQLFMPTEPVLGDLLQSALPCAMVHQRALQDGVASWEATTKTEDSHVDYFRELRAAAAQLAATPASSVARLCDLSSERLVAGVIWNDMPVSTRRAGGGERYGVVRAPVGALRGITRRHRATLGCELAVTDARFAYNPSTASMCALAAILAAPDALTRAFGGARVAAVVDAHRGDGAHMHAMVGSTRAERRMTIGAKRDRIVWQLKRWYAEATRRLDLFYIGHMLHTMQDSYAAGHVARTTDTRPSHVLQFQCFSAQSAKAHAHADGMRAYADMPPRHRRELYAVTRLFLSLFLAFVEHAARLRRADVQLLLRRQLAHLHERLVARYLFVPARLIASPAGGPLAQFAPS